MNIKRYLPLLLLFSLLIGAMASCKKSSSNDSSSGTVAANTPTPAKLGLYESDSSIYKLLFIAVPKIGALTVNQYLIFDTGSGGMVIDAHEVFPAATLATLVSSTGFTFTGDSTVVNGITITNQTSTISYGADAVSAETVYGNLAYAPVTIGDHDGTITVKRLPFMLYYKGVNASGKTESVGAFDIFGANSEYDVVFKSDHIVSPFSYYDPGTGLTRGFKMAALGTSNFSLTGTYVPGVLSIGLTSADLSSNGFTMHPLTASGNYGYADVISSTYTYGSKTVSSAYTLFDTGTEPYNYFQDPTATSNITLLPTGTALSVTTNKGFNYSSTITKTDYLSYVEKTSYSGSNVSIISLEFFLNNSYLLDFQNHQLGLKSN